MPPTTRTPGVDPFATGDTGPSTQPGDPDEPERITTPQEDTPTGDTPDTLPGDTPAEPGEDFDIEETRVRFLEHGDRADLLAIVDYYR